MKKYLKTIVSILIMFMIVGCMTITKASVAKENSIVDFLQNETSIDYENFKDSDVLTLIEELTNKYSTEDLADIMEQYSDELEQAGLDAETQEVATQFLRSTDTESLRTLLNELDLDEIKTRLNNGEKFDNIIEDTIENMPAEKLIGMAGKVLLTNKVVKAGIINTIIISCIITIYMIVVRWIIYKKAGKHGWAALIPIYKDVVWLKIAGLSPWLLLLFLLPIFGWIALSIIFIVSKFKIPVAFGQSAMWGLGLWFIPIVFESVIAFSKEFEYKKDDSIQEEAVETIE